jgi:tetratricopeptide (TPR) repeat protein
MAKKSSTAATPVVMAPPPRPQLTPEQAFALASQHQSQGRLKEAETILRQILQVRPNHAHALHLLGVIAHQAGKPELAIDLIGRAIASNGNVALFHANIGEMHRQQKRLAEAIAHGERAIALDPAMASAHSNLGIAYYDNKEYDKAEACQQRALQLNPALPSALNNMGSLMREHKRMDEAIAFYRKAFAANPNYLEPYNNLGATLITEEQPEEALKILTQVLQLDPNYGNAHCNMGCALNALERYDEAWPHLTKALQMRPDYPEAHIALAKTYQAKERLPEAELAALRAIEFAPDMAEAHSTLGGIYTEMGEAERALACFDKALQLDPESSAALLGKGNHHMEMGDMDTAENLFNQALEVSRNKLAARFCLTQVRKVRDGDENLAELEALTTQDENRPEGQALILNYALGKCYDDIKNYDQAFENFLEGARLKRKTLGYNEESQRRTFDGIIQIFDRPAIERLRNGGVASDLPIFVLGMPRSGTTLTEQIIASHPEVHGAGELRDLLQIAHRATSAGSIFPDNLKGLTPELVTAWGTDYLTGLRARAPDARHITDKMPGNFFAVGLIHAMLPGAKIIHVKRNPVDTCLSCFTRLFSHGQEFSYNLSELGRYYGYYARLMEHWRSVLPQDAFYEIRYEELVANQETQTRKLIEYCGLEWDDACLESHKTKRSIRTASVTQVRQPIYSSSVERWRKYEAHLRPLLEALGDLVT